MDELKKSFRPEFLNRIDEVIVFHSLTQDDVKQIVDLMMKRVKEQLKAKDVEIELTDAAKTLLAEKGYDPALGARPLRRDDPAPGRGPAVREAPVEGVPGRPDDHRRRARRRDRVRGRRRPAGRPPGRARGIVRGLTSPRGSGVTAPDPEDRWPGNHSAAGPFGVLGSDRPATGRKTS